MCVFNRVSKGKKLWKCLLIIFEKKNTNERVGFGCRIEIVLALDLLHYVMLRTKGNDCHAFEYPAVCVARLYRMRTIYQATQQKHRNHGLISTLPTPALVFFFSMHGICLWGRAVASDSLVFGFVVSLFRFRLALVSIWNNSKSRATWNLLFAQHSELLQWRTNKWMSIKCGEEKKHIHTLTTRLTSRKDWCAETLCKNQKQFVFTMLNLS